jgi:hypothetical protein
LGGALAAKRRSAQAMREDFPGQYRRNSNLMVILRYSF